MHAYIYDNDVIEHFASSSCHCTGMCAVLAVHCVDVKSINGHT